MTNPYAPPAAAVADVVVAVEEIALAGRGIRLGAAMLDGIIFGACTYIPFFAGFVPFTASARGYSAGAFVAGFLLAMMVFSVWAFFTIRYVTANGQTIAKRMLGIKVVRTDGSRASFSRIFWLRNIVSALPGIVPFLGVLYSIADPLLIFRESRKCIHDQIADTIVILA